MNPLYKIVKGILDLGRSMKKLVQPEINTGFTRIVKLSKDDIGLETYHRKRVNIIPILAWALGILIAIGIMNVVIRTVMESTSFQKNATGANPTVIGGYSLMWVLVAIPLIAIPIMVIRNFMKEED